jgi:Bacteriophage HK97-gp10, putative tail-component
VNFRATSKVTPVDLSRLMQRVVPVIVEAVNESQGIVVDEARAIAPVRDGDLVSKIGAGPIALIGNAVTGSVTSESDHAGFVEFGTGTRGTGTYPYDLPSAGVPFTGSWVYDYKNQQWKGMPAQPYMRPALDTARPAILEAFAERGLKIA